MTERPDKSEKLLAEALKLSASARARLAAELIASVDGGPEADAEAAWAAEIDRRVGQVLAGGERGADWRNVHARIEAKLGRK